MATQNLPAKSKAADIRALLEKSKQQMAMALPKHLTADRLLRVAMTSIQKTPKLLDCTPQSLLACVMTCAQLGLEPDQFLGQAYLVPFNDKRKNAVICTLIPGYRGYIALARRSGEMQTVSAQVVYDKDEFEIQYGVEDKLVHKPNLNGDRGKPIGAYCVFKYKDGGYSFDFLPVSDIEKVRARSKAAQEGPWVTDWAEMAKKTVIKRHAKLAPLSVEFQRAVALEDRAMAGESQTDLLNMDDDDVIEAESQEVTDEKTEEAPPDPKSIKAFEKAIPKTINPEQFNKFLDETATANEVSLDQLKATIHEQKQMVAILEAFAEWSKGQKKEEVVDMAPGPCPNNDGNTYKKSYCDRCKSRPGCPVWPE